MSVQHLARAAKPLGRSLAVARPATIYAPFSGFLRGHKYYTTSAVRQLPTGNEGGRGSSTGPGNFKDAKNASTWALSGVFAIAVGAGLIGWGLSELRHRGFPGTMMLDSLFPMPNYANLREMEQVCDMSQHIPRLGPKDMNKCVDQGNN